MGKLRFHPLRRSRASVVLLYATTLFLAACQGLATTEPEIRPAVATEAQVAAPQATATALPVEPGEIAASGDQAASSTGEQTEVAPAATAIISAAESADIPPTVAAPDYYPVTWTVHPYQLSSGELGYMIDQAEVLDQLKARYWEFYRYFSYQDGLPSMEQAEQDLAALAVPGDEGSGAAAFLPRLRVTYERGEYFRVGAPQEYVWREDLFWFSADGREARLVAEFGPGVPGERVNIATGEVVESIQLPAVLYQIVMYWDEQDGIWRWASTGTEDLALYPRPDVAASE